MRSGCRSSATCTCRDGRQGEQRHLHVPHRATQKQPVQSEVHHTPSGASDAVSGWSAKKSRLTVNTDADIHIASDNVSLARDGRRQSGHASAT